MPTPDFTQPLVANFDVILNGSPMKATELAYVMHVTVDEDLGLPAMCVIEFGGADTLGKTLPWVDDPRFDIGQSVEIKLGYGNKMEKMFAGEITGLEPVFSRSRLPSLIVRAFNRLHRLTRGRKSRTFMKQKDSEIASKIAQDAGLTADQVQGAESRGLSH